MKLLKSVLCLLPPALLTTNANANAYLLVNLDDFPAWFQEAAARETTVTSTGNMTIEAFNVNAEVRGKPQIQDISDGVWYYTMDIGTSAPVECYAFTEFDGPANSLNAIIEHSLGGAEQLNGQSLSGRFNMAVGMDMIGDTPYLQLDTLYTLGKGTKKVSGVLKGLSAQTDQSLQICIHNEMGYQGAFLDVFTSFVQAFTQNESNPELYDTTYRMSINGMPLGYTRERHTIDQDGDIETLTRDATISPVDEFSVSRSDSQTREWSRPDGSLINGEEYAIENGRVSSQFAIQYDEDHWVVSGQMHGKDVNTQLEYKEWLLSGFGSYTETADLLASDAASAVFHMWVSDADPTSAIPVTLTKLTDNPDANIQLEFGPLTMDYLADKNGALQKAYIKQGGATIMLEKIYSKGAPLLP